MKDRFEYSFHTDAYGWLDAGLAKFPGDIYIEMQQVFGNEDFAMEMLEWCENAQPGDLYEDEDVRVRCIA